jgi:hypothetical protein
MAFARPRLRWQDAYWLLAFGFSAGCASPGPPRPPSLQLPERVKDLSVQRSGNSVEISFHAPDRSTDKGPLPPPAVQGIVCRELEMQGCITVAGLTAAVAPAAHGSKKAAAAGELITLHDPLPPELTQGRDRLLAYRVEFFNASGRSAGKSEAAYTIAGAAPAQVRGLRAEGSRAGIALRWQPQPGESSVVLHREDLSATATARRQNKAEASGADEWLDTHAITGGFEGDETLDATAQPDTTYRYSAVRQREVLLGGHKIELRSATSTPVTFTLRPVYPPLAPTGISAAGFATANGYAIDLIWQPVDDPALAGYNVYRMDAGGARVKLNAAPVMSPAFHDATAIANTAYRYAVTAVDGRGNESPAATVSVAP